MQFVQLPVKTYYRKRIITKRKTHCRRMDAPKLCSCWKSGKSCWKGIKYVASSFGKTIVKQEKTRRRRNNGSRKSWKSSCRWHKTASHKVKEGVNFVASTAKGFADKIGSLWNKGATTVKQLSCKGMKRSSTQ